MTAATIQHNLVLKTTECGSCGAIFAIPDHMISALKRTGKTFYCPNGHSLSWEPGPTEADRLREMLSEANRSKTELATYLAAEREARWAADTELAKAKKESKRVAKRLHAGVCPCCNRTFVNLARHMATKHKDAGIEPL